MNTGKIQSGWDEVIGRALLWLGLCALAIVPQVNAANTMGIAVDIDNHCNTSTQLCEPAFTLEVETQGMLQVMYKVPPRHCSSLRLHILVDGVLKTTTGFLGWYGAPPPFDTLPLQTELIDLGGVVPGKHLLAVQAEGQPGGCNPAEATADLQHWFGTLYVFTDASISLGSSLSGMSAVRGKVICQNLTTKQKRTIRIQAQEEARSWDCKKAGLVINSGDKIRIKTVTRGYAD